MMIVSEGLQRPPEVLLVSFLIFTLMNLTQRRHLDVLYHSVLIHCMDILTFHEITTVFPPEDRTTVTFSNMQMSDSPSYFG